MKEREKEMWSVVENGKRLAESQSDESVLAINLVGNMHQIRRMQVEKDSAITAGKYILAVKLRNKIRSLAGELKDHFEAIQTGNISNGLEECPSPMSASEALFGFMGWLTCREEVVTLSSSHDAGVAARLVSEFCKANNLPEPRDKWAANITHPKDNSNKELAKAAAESGSMDIQAQLAATSNSNSPIVDNLKIVDAFAYTSEDMTGGGCLFANIGRGDCEHYVGLPGKSIPGQDDDGPDTVDEYDKPIGWCWSCWKSHQISVLKSDSLEIKAWSEVAAESNRAITAYLKKVWPKIPEYGLPVDGIRKLVHRLDPLIARKVDLAMCDPLLAKSMEITNTKCEVKNRYLTDGESIGRDYDWWSLSLEVLLDHRTLSGVISLIRTGSKVRIERVMYDKEGTVQVDPADPQNILTETKVYSYERIRLVPVDKGV